MLDTKYRHGLVYIQKHVYSTHHTSHLHEVGWMFHNVIVFVVLSALRSESYVKRLLYRREGRSGGRTGRMSGVRVD